MKFKRLFPDEALILKDVENGMLYEMLELETGPYGGVQLRTLLEMRKGTIPAGVHCEVDSRLLYPLTHAATVSLAFINSKIEREFDR